MWQLGLGKLKEDLYEGKPEENALWWMSDNKLRGGNKGKPKENILWGPRESCHILLIERIIGWDEIWDEIYKKIIEIIIILIEIIIILTQLLIVIAQHELRTHCDS